MRTGNDLNAIEPVGKYCCIASFGDATHLFTATQDMRLVLGVSKDHSIICHNEKLAYGDSATYLRDARRMVEHVFAEGGPWPDVIMTRSILKGGPRDTTVETEVTQRRR